MQRPWNQVSAYHIWKWRKTFQLPHRDTNQCNQFTASPRMDALLWGNNCIQRAYNRKEMLGTKTNLVYQKKRMDLHPSVWAFSGQVCCWLETSDWNVQTYSLGGHRTPLSYLCKSKKYTITNTVQYLKACIHTYVYISLQSSIPIPQNPIFPFSVGKGSRFQEEKEGDS